MTPLDLVRNKKQAVVHASELFGDDFFVVKVLEAGSWFLTNHREFDEFKVIFHYTRGRANPFHMLIGARWRMIRIARGISRQLGRLPIGASQHPETDNARSVEKRPHLDRHKATLLGSIRTDPQGWVVATDVGRIILRQTRDPLFLGVVDWLSAQMRGIALYLRCVTSSGFSVEKLRRLEVDGLRVGDLVASSTLRLYPQAGGALRSSKLAILSQLVDASSFLRYIDRACPVKETGTLVFVRERTYLDGLYMRRLHARGAMIFDWFRYDCDYKIYRGEDEYLHPQIAKPSKGVAGKAERRKVEEYLAGRIENPSGSLYYMRSHIGMGSALVDWSGQFVETQHHCWYPVLFLHSFDDAQFAFGWDGFDDLYGWVMFTVDKLVANPVVARVLIKPHPNVEYTQYPGDKRALEKLRRRFSVEPKVVWLSAACSVDALRGPGHFVGITHHGSVAEELVYRGIPAIGSVYAPWGKGFRFLTTWETPREYAEILDSLHLAAGVGEEQRRLLMDFVYSYRVSFNRVYSPKFCCPFLAVFGESCPDSIWDGFRKASELLRVTPHDDPRIKGYVDGCVRQAQMRGCNEC